MEVSGQLHAPAALLRGKDHGTLRMGGWVDPREGLDVVAKTKSPFSPLQQSKVARHFTD